MKANVFLRKIGLNFSFRLKGFHFDGTLLELLQEYDRVKSDEKITDELSEALNHLCHNVAIIKLVSESNGSLLQENYDTVLRVLEKSKI